MIAAPKPFDESLRLEALAGLDVLDTSPEPGFSDFVDLARMITGARIALISLIDAERQWFKACVGLTITETPRAVSFCAHAILHREVMWIEDARRDIRFADNPLVVGEPKIRFYAGAPITLADSRIGTLCVIDDRPRAWDQMIADQLATLASIIADRLEARKQLLDARAASANLFSTGQMATAAAFTEAAAASEALAPKRVMGEGPSSLAQPDRLPDHPSDDHQYRLLVDEVEDYAIYLLDPEGNVVSWNAGARRIKGYEASDIVGKHFSTFYTSEDRIAGVPTQALRQARVNGRFADEGWRVRKDGTQLWASVVITALYDAGRFVGFSKITRDLSERHRADLALAAAVQGSEAANRAKSEFLANMSHEIRTPLNGVVGLADVLLRTNLDPHQSEMASIIASSARTLERLLGDILDLSRIEAGHVSLSPEAFDLAEAVSTVAGLARAKAEAGGLEFEFRLHADADRIVVGDKLRIQQILTNLLSNAVKFTSAGRVSLEVRLSVDDEGSGRGLFTVRDTGVGFDPTRKDLIFGRFTQADGSITRRFGGTGLGMAISRQLAEIMNATLECDSIPGQGSIFELAVPLGLCAREERGDPVVDGQPSEQVTGRPLRILLAEDHPINRKVCELILSQIEAEVVAVENGALAVELYRSADFDVILMDMQMPVMDGLTAVRQIRTHERETGRIHTPIFMLTANVLPEHVEQGRAAGADHHVAKPITSASLFAALEMLPDRETEQREEHNEDQPLGQAMAA